jgi:hypothetical protein
MLQKAEAAFDQVQQADEFYGITAHSLPAGERVLALGGVQRALDRKPVVDACATGTSTQDRWGSSRVC